MFGQALDRKLSREGISSREVPPEMADPTQERASERKEEQDTRELSPPWLNTSPRGNPATDERDLARSVERFEAVLGR
jgi:hypothetical protein